MMTPTTNNLSIPYKGRKIGSALAIVFGLLGGCGYFLALALCNGIGLISTLNGVGQYFLIIPVLISSALYLLDTAPIRVTQEGISLPLSFAFSMNWRCARSWNDLSHVLVKTNASHLVVHFKSSGFADIDTSRIGKEQIEQLALAIEIRAREAARKSPLTWLFCLNVCTTKRD
jgi:hypothetical protein